MKSIGAVWMAAARQILWKLLAILAAMSGLELLLFHGKARQYAADLALKLYDCKSFGDLLEQAGIYYVFVGAIVLLTVVLALQGCDLPGGKLRYTLQRLPMGESAATLLWAAVHVACWVIFWAAQVGVVLLCWQWHTPSSAPELELFVEFYLDGFLHGLLPMEHAVLWIRLILWGLCMGAGTAWFGMQQRRGKIALVPVLASVLGLVTFRDGTNLGASLASVTACIFGMMFVYCVGRIWWRAYEED